MDVSRLIQSGLNEGVRKINTTGVPTEDNRPDQEQPDRAELYNRSIGVETPLL